MSEYHKPFSHQKLLYQIRLKGHLTTHWQDWFEGLSFSFEQEDTVLTGFIQDQAALHGLLKKIRDLGIPLVSIVELSDKSD